MFSCEVDVSATINCHYHHGWRLSMQDLWRPVKMRPDKASFVNVVLSRDIWYDIICQDKFCLRYCQCQNQCRRECCELSKLMILSKPIPMSHAIKGRIHTHWESIYIPSLFTIELQNPLHWTMVVTEWGTVQIPNEHGFLLYGWLMVTHQHVLLRQWLLSLVEIRLIRICFDQSGQTQICYGFSWQLLSRCSKTCPHQSWRNFPKRIAKIVLLVLSKVTLSKIYHYNTCQDLPR